MSVDLWLDEADALELAIALRRAPARFPELLRGHGALPAGVTELIRHAWVSVRRGGRSAPDERCEAAMFFLEHVLLAPEGDHYRVLGVGRDASAEQIRAHFRMMIGIFHPDRWAGAGDGARQGARITSAYRVLRNAGERAAYDLRLHQGEQGPVRSFADARMRVAPCRGEDDPEVGEGVLSSLGSRHFPKLVLGGVALVGVLLVASVYLTRPPYVAPRGGLPASQSQASGASEQPGEAYPGLVDTPSGDAQESLGDASVAHGGAESDERRLSGAVGIPVGLEGLALGWEAEQGVEIPRIPGGRASEELSRVSPGTAVAPVSNSRAAAAGTHDASTPPRRRGAAPVQDDAVIERTSPAEAGRGAIGMPQPSPRVVPAVAVTAFGVREAQLMVARFAAAYQQGDIEPFMALFADDAQSESGGTAQIRRDYQRLFRESRDRHLQIADLRWSVRPEVIRGEGGYLARVRRVDEGEDALYTGSLRFEIVRRGEVVLIAGLYHQPAR